MEIVECLTRATVGDRKSRIGTVCRRKMLAVLDTV